MEKEGEEGREDAATAAVVLFLFSGRDSGRSAPRTDADGRRECGRSRGSARPPDARLPARSGNVLAKYIFGEGGRPHGKTDSLGVSEEGDTARDMQVESPSAFSTCT